MREIARVQQGFFPTQDRIVRAVAGLFRLPAKPITVLDAGCGTGAAIDGLQSTWFERSPNLRVSLLGVESDKHRHAQAEEKLGSGSVLWAAIEDTCLEGGASLLWFNPPYDRIRGAGRVETVLFNKVREWPARGHGLMVMIVPDYILSDPDTGLAFAVERDFEVTNVWRYPEPEYQQFKQCVLLARRRERALAKTLVVFPVWATRSSHWPILPDRTTPLADLRPSGRAMLHRSRLGDEVLSDVISTSALRSSLLREATSPAPPVGRPLLPLKAGHLALALAGGLCDGVIEERGQQFLMKGTLTRAVHKTASRDQLDEKGNPTAVIDTYRTKYAMNVRCLLNDGSIENYTSADPADDDPEDSEETDTA